MSTAEQQYARGTLLVFEGGDGTGKTTIAKLLKEKLQKEFPGVPVHYQQNPDGQIRELLLNRKDVIPSNAELLMFCAGHLVLMENIIKPALARGEIVILDRYYFTTMAYQGFGRENLPLTKLIIDQVIEQQPDLFFFVSADVEVAMQRLKSRGAMNFMDQEKEDFHRRTIAGFEWIANPAHQMNRSIKCTHLTNNDTIEDVDFILSALVDDWVRIAPEKAPGGIGDHAKGLPLPPVTINSVSHTFTSRVIENGEVAGQAAGQALLGDPVLSPTLTYQWQRGSGESKEWTDVTNMGRRKMDVRALAQRFMGWRLPSGFSPDCGISFDGRKDDEWNKNKTWPIGTNLFSVEQAEEMLNYVLEGVNIPSRLWIWKNGDHYLAYGHEYPCVEPGGDPLTIGQPAGVAYFKPSFGRSSDNVSAEESDSIESLKNGLRDLSAQLDEHKRLVERLHNDETHPDYEYEDSKLPYSSMDAPTPPDGVGWEPNPRQGREWTRDDDIVFYHFRRLKSCKERDEVDPFAIPLATIPKITGSDLRSLIHEAQLHGRIAGQLMKSEDRPPLYTGEEHRSDLDNGFYILQPSAEIPDVHLLMNVGNLRFLLGREYNDIRISARNPAGLWSAWNTWHEKTGVAINPLDVIRQTRTFLNSLD